MKAERIREFNRIWVVPGIGLLVGVVSLFCAQLLDAGLNGRTPEWKSFGYYLLAGGSYAVSSFLALRTLPLTRTRRLAVEKLAVLSSTLGFSFLLVPTLIAQPDSTGRWLAYLYAFSILFGWLALRLPPASEQNLVNGPPRWLDEEDMTYAPFAAVALALLAASLVCAFQDLRSPSIQLANWAYGFLLLAVSAATLCLLQSRLSFEHRLGRVSGIILPVLVLAFFPIASLVEANSQTLAERQFITDVYPHFLADQLKDGDILMTDSPTLRLNSIPRLATSLTLDPDARGQAVWEDLTRGLETKQRVLWITVPGQSRDTKGRLATFLKANGCLDAISTTSLPVQVYELNKPFAAPIVLSPYLANRIPDAFDPVRVGFGPIEMTGLRHEPRACSHDSVAVAVRWKLASKTSSPLRISVLLLDAKGRRIHTQDYYIDDPNQRHTDQWEPGATAAYYLLTIPLGTAPGAYTLGAGVYAMDQPEWFRIRSAEGVALRGNYIELGQVELYRAQDVSADPWRSRSDAALLPANVAMQNGLALDGYEVSNPTIIPGQSLQAVLRWHALDDVLPSYTTGVALRQGDKLVVEQSSVPVDGTYPTDHWKSGEYVTEWRELRVPPDAAGGSARLEVSVEGGKSVWLADINIEPLTRTYQMPTMAFSTRATFRRIGDLIGYDSPQLPVSARQPFELTLYWRGGASVDKEYVVFAQLLSPDGRLIAQSDSAPAQGRRPTRSWLPGEIIADHHSLQLKNHDYRGEAKLIVGLYEAETGKRLAIEGNADDYFTLPTSVQVVDQ